MSENRTEIECRLTARGTQEANAKVIDDLVIPDPSPEDGKKIIDGDDDCDG